VQERREGVESCEDCTFVVLFLESGFEYQDKISDPALAKANTNERQKGQTYTSAIH
jgi:hypothetical protein